MFADHKKKAAQLEALIAATGFDLAADNLTEENALADYMAGAAAAQIQAARLEETQKGESDRQALTEARAEIARLQDAAEVAETQSNAKDIQVGHANSIQAALATIGFTAPAAGSSQEAFDEALATAVDAQVAKKVAALGHGGPIDAPVATSDGPKTTREAWASTKI